VSRIVSTSKESLVTFQISIDFPDKSINISKKVYHVVHMAGECIVVQCLVKRERQLGWYISAVL
jgi:hypothetical protein